MNNTFKKILAGSLLFATTSVSLHLSSCEVDIRKYEATNDEIQVLEIIRQSPKLHLSPREEERRTPEQMLSMLKNPMLKTFVACNGTSKQIVGYVNYVLQGIPSSGEINGIAVHPDYRHQKIGTRLLKLAIANMDTSIIYLTVLADNENAIKLYEKTGFKKHALSTAALATYLPGCLMYHYYKQT